MDVIRNPEYENLLQEYFRIKEQLAVILEERADLLHHKALTIKTDYILKIGQLEYELFQLECAIARNKRKIEMIQACINLQVPVNEKQIEEQLDKEYSEYTAKLEKMASDIDVANYINKCERLTDEENKELKKLYRALAKKLHPDVNPNQADEQRILWSRVTDAYEAANLEMLKVLYEITTKDTDMENNTDDISALEQLKEKISSLKEKFRNILSEIENIKKAFPFNVVELLNNRELLEKRQNELHAALKEGRQMLETYQNHLLMMTPCNCKIIH